MVRYSLSVMFFILLSVLAWGCNDSKRSRAAVPIGPSFQVVTSSVPNARAGDSVNETLTTSNGQGPYTWSVVSGSLPNGVDLGANDGGLTGTPVSPGNFSFRVRVVDANSLLAERDLTMDIGNEALLWLAGGLFADGTNGVAYSLDISSRVSGGTPPYTFSISGGALPTGLTISSDGVVSGTPTSTGTVSVTVRATASTDPYTGSGSVADKATTITIN